MFTKIEIRGHIVELSGIYCKEEDDWIFTARYTDGSVVAFCRDKSWKRAEIISLSRLLTDYEDNPGE